MIASCTIEAEYNNAHPLLRQSLPFSQQLHVRTMAILLVWDPLELKSMAGVTVRVWHSRCIEHGMIFSSTFIHEPFPHQTVTVMLLSRIFKKGYHLVDTEEKATLSLQGRDHSAVKQLCHSFSASSLLVNAGRFSWGEELSCSKIEQKSAVSLSKTLTALGDTSATIRNRARVV